MVRWSRLIVMTIAFWTVAGYSACTPTDRAHGSPRQERDSRRPTVISNPSSDPHFGVFGLTSDFSRDLGTNWTRTALPWSYLEPRKGRYQFPKPDGRFQGLQVLVTLRADATRDQTGQKGNDNSPGTVSHFPRDMRRWRAAISALASEMKGKIAVYQIENEVDAGGYWAGTEDEYVELLRATSSVIRRVDPEAKIAAAGFTGGWDFDKNEIARKKRVSELLTRCLPYVDIIDVHLYFDYQSIEQRVAFFRSLTDKPIWCTELGGPDIRVYEGRDQYVRLQAALREPDPDGPNRQGKSRRTPAQRQQVLRGINPQSIWLDRKRLAAVQADEVIRRFVVTLGSGVEKAFWFHMSDLDPASAPLFHWMGLTQGKRRKPAFEAYVLLTREMSGFSNLRRVDLESGVWAYRYDVGEREAMVLWAEDGTRDAQIEAFAPSLQITSLEVTNGVGRIVSKPAQVANGKLTLTLNSKPVFIRRGVAD